MAKRIQKIPISMRALIARINRKLRPDDEVLRAARGARAKQEFGGFYIINRNRELIVAHHVDPEDMGRKLNAMREWEQLVQGQSERRRAS
jgi:hypothetical protein